MKSFIHRSNTLEYEVSGSGTPFVFLHGLGGSTVQIKNTYEPIDGVMLINMNQQGHGESTADWDTLDFDRLGDDAVALLDHLGIKKAVFGGISMGAAVSLNIASRFPDRLSGLILIRNAWIDRPFSGDRILAYADMGFCLHEGGFEAFRKTEGWTYVEKPSAYTRNAFTLPFSEDFNVQNWQKFCILPGKQPIPSSSVLSALPAIPAVIIACRNDYCHPFEHGIWVHEHIPGSLFYEIPDKDTDSAAHKEQINSILRRFFEKGSAT